MDSLGLYEIYGYHHQPFWQTWLFTVSIVAVVGVMVSIGVFYAVRSYKRRKKVDLWKIWFAQLNALETQKIADARFYGQVSDIIKEVVCQKLDILKSLTDLELALILKNHASSKVNLLGEVMERAAAYKYDPLHAEEAKQKKELALVREAMCDIQQMEQKQ